MSAGRELSQTDKAAQDIFEAMILGDITPTQAIAYTSPAATAQRDAAIAQVDAAMAAGGGTITAEPPVIPQIKGETEIPQTLGEENMAWAALATALGTVAPDILETVMGIAGVKTTKTKATAGEKKRHRKYIIRRGRRYKWDSRYQGYVAVSRRRSLSRKEKLKLAIALVSATGEKGMNPLLLDLI